MISSAMADRLLASAEAAASRGEAPLISVVYSADELLAVTPSAGASRRSPLQHGEISALSMLGYRLREMPRPRILLSTVEPCLMCFGAAIVNQADAVAYVLPAHRDGISRFYEYMKAHDPSLPLLVGPLPVEGIAGAVDHFVATHPDHHHSAYLRGVVAEHRRAVR